MKLQPTDSLTTPDWLFNRLNAEFNFTLDTAASADNAKLPRYFTVDDNGLRQPWHNETVWCNPPYSGRHLSHWTRKAWREYHHHGATVVMLVPVSVSSIWWRKYAVKAEVFFFHRRIKFGDTKSSGLRDSALLVFREPRWHPLTNDEFGRATYSLWDTRWGDLMYPAAIHAGRWWHENYAPPEEPSRLRRGVKLRLKAQV